MNDLLQIIVLLAVAGIVPLFIPRRGKLVAGIIALAVSVWGLVRSIQLFMADTESLNVHLFDLGGVMPFDFALKQTSFSAFLLIFIMLFGVLVILYSLSFLRNRDTASIYYSYLLWTLAAAAGVVLSDNLLILLIFWEILTAVLFFLINMGDEGHSEAAAKSFTILGFTDAAMLLGIVLIWVKFETLSISALSANPIAVSNPMNVIIFLLLFSGAIAKAGGMPLHSWLPNMAKPTLAPIMAFLPASLDKLLGIYFLVKLSIFMFAIEAGGALSIAMMIIGAVTIILAVFMALIQHNLKKLLSFHAVSQVGYMILGVGSGIPIAIIGGVFHMLNNAVYKSGLFLGAGAVESQTGTGELDELGGLAKLMPVTFITTVVTAMSISGVPPFNGFVSKWLVYQGMLAGGGSHIIFLVIAIFGSALTLASFIKILHSVFLGRRDRKFDNVRETDFAMQIPMVILAIICILFGIFAKYPLEQFIIPALGGPSGLDISGNVIVTTATQGLWHPTLATILLIVGIIIGLIIYLIGRAGKVRVDENPWVGGNIMDNEEMRIPGTHFYKTVTDELGSAVKSGFRDGDKGAFDIYRISGSMGDRLVQIMRRLHDGVLSTYLSWVIIGLAVLAFILILNW